jgi:hypothetical protein
MHDSQHVTRGFIKIDAMHTMYFASTGMKRQALAKSQRCRRECVSIYLGTKMPHTYFMDLSNATFWVQGPYSDANYEHPATWHNWDEFEGHNNL